MREKSKGTDYKCSQVFGYKGNNDKIHEEDIISKLKFDQDGKHIAVGDKAGRIILFKSNAGKKKDERFSYYSEFQAYSREFDPLNSNDVDEEILDLSWMKCQSQYKKLMTMNCKTIKLWKIFERPEKKIIRTAGKELSFPKFQEIENSINATIQEKFDERRKSITTKFEDELIGMDQTSNEEYILSSDTTKTVLWNIEKSTVPFLVTDLQKNKKIEEVKETINCLKAHPISDSMFVYGTNHGSLVLTDSRTADHYRPLTMKVDISREKMNFFSHMISSYSSVAFLNNNKQIATRDCLGVKVWDISKTDKPIISIGVEESLKSKLSEMFENDCIFDKFDLSMSKDSNTILTGNYNNNFHAIDLNDLSNTQYEVNFKKQTVFRPIIPNKSPPIAKMDYTRKVIASDFNPKSNMLAVASLNCFLIYSM